MAFIHRKPGWPNFEWDIRALASALAAVRHKQGKLLGRMQELGFAPRAEASLTVITSDVVKSSAIEGEVLNATEVRSSVARRLGLEVGGLAAWASAPAGRDVEGVVEMMLDATQRSAEPLTTERLFAWHASLFPTPRSGLPRISVGAWRSDTSGPMQVVSGPVGHQRVHFEAPGAERLEGEMEAFLRWFNAGEAGPSQPPDPVLKAAIAHFWFVTIHPFDDGNGRIARAIADLLLARADSSTQRFYSMSSQIAAERRDYYARLESAQRGDLDITLWLAWFLGCLDRAISSAETTLASVLHKARVWRQINASGVNERQRVVINRLLDGFEGFLTNAKYAALAACSPDTALRDIRELLERGILLQNAGRGRSTSYQIADHGQAAP